MSKNGYLERRDADRREFFRAGLEVGRQQIIDMMTLVLGNPEIMGKDTFGGMRTVAVLQGIKEELEFWNPAWQKDDDTDVYRVKLDERLADRLGKKMLDSFQSRYPCMLEYDYQKGRWK